MEKTYIITEIGSVHDGSLGNAKKMIEMIGLSGADAAKFQTHIASAETLRDAPMPSYFTGEPRYEYFKRTSFTVEQWCIIKKTCQENNVAFISSPFSVEAVELLEKVNVDKYKIPSGEVTNTILLEEVAKTGREVVLSSGMSSWKELDDAVDILSRYHDKITILQCTSEYPCSYEKVGLNILQELKDRYSFPVGLSDHTLTPYASLAAVTLGATVIEKHLTFSRFMYGSDARNSMEPQEFTDLVKGIRAIEIMKQNPVDKNKATESLHEMKTVFEKSIVSLIDIPKGAIITSDMLGLKKPGTGLPAKRLKDIIGKKTSTFIAKDTLIKKLDLIEK